MHYKINLPRLGKRWIQIGFIRVEDKGLVERELKKHRIPHKIEGNKLHAKGDPRQKKFKELFVGRGYRREAMKVMKILFSAPRGT